MANRPHSLVIVVLAACSSQGSVGPSDAASVDETQLTDSSAPLADASEDATMDAQTPLVVGTDASCAGPPCDAGGVVLGEMHLFELAGTVATDSGLSTVVQLDAAASFHVAVPEDYDNRVAGIGCTADHYDATGKPAPADADAGWLRMSGFTGGPLLAGGQATQPIVCMREAGYYGCAYPSGTIVSGAFFAGAATPLGPGPITFALPGAADFGARALSGAPIGIASTNEDLNAIHYSPTTDTALHITCSPTCAPGRIAVNLTAMQASTASAAWPYPSVGIVRCVFQAGSSVVIPSAAIAAMFAQDSALDTVVTAVALMPAAPLATTDDMGNQLVAEVGRGSFGVAPR
jgi:hypothetical protein